MDRDDAFKPFKNLLDRIEEVASSLGLTVERFVVDPPDKIHLIFGVGPDAVLSEYEKEQRRIDAEFELLERSYQEDGVLEQKMQIMKQDVADFMDGTDD